eukprot:TRINITY_DN4580_c0_g1_i1.p1 TRINITY_DN4580_c0_g1~~TRINITY_DN4580_c0_g1_i1.p1  ORF type:complete len:508 (+),score=133.45 TRINITY_DN4580_c0_g1_i1:43-1566(+)
MFYEQMVLAKKGPLGKVWLAAHWEKKLTKAQIKETNIVDTVKKITNPKAPMALRLSGHLLLGVVRIYHKKVQFLYTDCSEALVKIKMAFRPGVVDMEETVANLNAITLPDAQFGTDFEITLPEITLDALPGTEEDVLQLNTARRRELTLVAEVGGQRREDMDISQNISPDDLAQFANQEFGIDFELKLGDGDDQALALDEEPATGLSRSSAAFDLSGEPAEDLGAASFEPGSFEPMALSDDTLRSPFGANFGMIAGTEGPIDIPAIGEMTPEQRRGVKRKFVAIDRRTQLSSEVMKRRIEDPSDTLRELEIAPVNKKQMLRKEREIAGPEELFLRPNDDDLPAFLRDAFTRNMKTDKPDLPELGEEEQGSDIARREEEDIMEHDFGDFGAPEFEERRRSPAREEEPEEEPFEDLPTQQRIEEEVQDNISTSVSLKTRRMQAFLEQSFSTDADLNFNQMFANKPRRTAASAFFELLVLKSKGYIEINQQEPYGDITVTRSDLSVSTSA